MTDQEFAYQHALNEYADALKEILARADTELKRVESALAQNVTHQPGHSIGSAAFTIVQTPDRLNVIQQFAYIGKNRAAQQSARKG